MALRQRQRTAELEKGRNTNDTTAKEGLQMLTIQVVDGEDTALRQRQGTAGLGRERDTSNTTAKNGLQMQRVVATESSGSDEEDMASRRRQMTAESIAALEKERNTDGTVTRQGLLAQRSLIMGLELNGHFQEALAKAKECVALLESATFLGRTHPFTVTQLCIVARLQGKLRQSSEAIATARDCVFRCYKGSDVNDTLRRPCVATLIQAFFFGVDNPQARETVARECVELPHFLHGLEDRPMLQSVVNLAGKLCSANHPSAAISLLRGCLEVMQRYKGQDHRDTMWIMLHLAKTLARSNQRHWEAISLAFDCYAFGVEHLGVDSSFTADAHACSREITKVFNHTGLTMKLRGEGARVSREPAQSARQQQEGQMTAGAGEPPSQVVDVVFESFWGERPDETEAWVRQFIESAWNVQGVNSEFIIFAMKTLFEVLFLRDRDHEALSVACECVSLSRHLFGENNPQTLDTMYSLARILHWLNIHTDALDCAQRCLEGRKEAMGIENQETLNAMSLIAIIHLSMMRIEEANSIGQECLDMQKRLFGRYAPRTLETMLIVARTNFAMRKVGKATKMARNCLKWTRHALGNNHPAILEPMEFLIKIYLQTDDLEAAVSMGQMCLEAQDRILGQRHRRTLCTFKAVLAALEHLQESDLLAAGRRELAWRMGDTDPVTQDGWCEAPSWRSSPGEHFVAALGQRQPPCHSLPSSLATTPPSSLPGNESSGDEQCAAMLLSMARNEGTSRPPNARTSEATPSQVVGSRECLSLQHLLKYE